MRLDTEPMSPLPDGGGLSAFRMTDAPGWDAFVERAEHRAFPQLWAWGELRVDAGWRPIRLAVGRTTPTRWPGCSSSCAAFR